MLLTKKRQGEKDTAVHKELFSSVLKYIATIIFGAHMPQHGLNMMSPNPVTTVCALIVSHGTYQLYLPVSLINQVVVTSLHIVPQFNHVSLTFERFTMMIMFLNLIPAHFTL